MASQKFVALKERPGCNGIPQAENFEFKEANNDDTLADGEVLVKTLYLSVDPYMRCRMNSDTGAPYLGPWEIGAPCVGGGVGVVLESSFDGLQRNDLVQSFDWPWKTINKMEGAVLQKIKNETMKSKPSLALGVLGMTGLTAYLGIKKKAFISPSKSQTVVVSGAAGACGSTAGQIARIEGASNIVGICGTIEKCKFLREDLGFHSAINYQLDNIENSLKCLCPKGIDVYFDNVGGEISNSVIKQMNGDSHVVLCGQIAVYNQDVPYPPPIPEEITKIIKEKNITRERFLVLNYQDEMEESLAQLISWVEEGKLKYRETVAEGIENIGKAFVSVMTGGNIGKQVVKVCDVFSK